MGKLKLYIVGGLGDASRRKYGVLLANGSNCLANEFELAGIADIPRMKNGKDDIDILLSETKERRPKWAQDKTVFVSLRTCLLNGTEYFQFSPESDLLPDKFLDKVNGGVVDISTPNKFHFPFLKQLLERTSAHIIVEKPVVKSLEEALQLQEYLPGISLDGRVTMNSEHYSYYDVVMYFVKNLTTFFAGGTLPNLGRIPSLGKIKDIEAMIEETDGFADERNREIINVTNSGGGIGLDMGIHALAFLRNIGAMIDYESIEAITFKAPLKEIADRKYKETSFTARFDIAPGELFADDCKAYISVGKLMPKKNKKFVIRYERGEVVLNIGEKSIRIDNEYGVPFCFNGTSFSTDPFYNVYLELKDCIESGRKPLTTLESGIENVKDVFMIYGKVKREEY